MNMAKEGKITVLVTNDLVTDQRVHKVCESLTSFGYEVELIGRKLKGAPPLGFRTYKTKRLRMLFNQRVWFYAEYNIRIAVLLFFKRSNAYLANDLDTLPAAWLVSVLKGVKLFYDSHEYFTEVPELISRPKVRMIWRKIEAFILPRLKKSYTVSPSIAAAYKKLYGIEMKVVCNYPYYFKGNLQCAEDKVQKVVFYQGVLNIDRGLEEAILAMEYMKGVILRIAGDGDVAAELKQLVKEKGLANKVEFLGRVPLEELQKETMKADVGISLEKMNGLNYTYALPNKLFDYIQLGIPVLVSPLPEVERILTEFEVGLTISNYEPKHIAAQLTALLADDEQKRHFIMQLALARKAYCWEKEESKLKALFLD
jgi:glycosyltransferase involved in cell wall biosynthesis